MSGRGVRNAVMRVLIASLLAVEILSYAHAEEAQTPAASDSEKLFLDRLMVLESRGFATVRNPRSTAFGPFQFLEATFLEVVRRRFPSLMDGKTDRDVLAMRADPKVSRDVALMYSRENAAYLNEKGIAPSPACLRLAFLLGPSGALKVLSSKPEEHLSSIIAAKVLAANPYLKDMTVGELIERTEEEMAALPDMPKPSMPQRPAKLLKVDVRCSLARASCRKWLALAERRLAITR
jgi:hypothetical protein